MPTQLPKRRLVADNLVGIPNEGRCMQHCDRCRCFGVTACLLICAGTQALSAQALGTLAAVPKSAAFTARFAKADSGNLSDLLKALAEAEPGTVANLLDALKKNSGPKADDASAFRTVLLSSRKLPATHKWKAVEVLRQWTNGRSFGADSDKEWKSELEAWGRWYLQTFPKEPGLPGVTLDRPAESKYKYAELLIYLQRDPRGMKGDAVKGQQAFAKANCIKCHRFGSEGESIGPDLTDVSKRLKRSEILESIVDPSKVISDQYRSSHISTSDGRTFIGLAVAMGDSITILLNDGSKSKIKKADVESTIASLVSVMPERLLDELTKEEIADLFAFLQSPAPNKK
jgi:putative heme-binding domain-containing protein